MTMRLQTLFVTLQTSFAWSSVFPPLSSSSLLSGGGRCLHHRRHSRRRLVVVVLSLFCRCHLVFVVVVVGEVNRTA